MEYRMFYENLRTYSRPYSSYTAYCTEMGVMKFETEEAMLREARRLTENGVKCYHIEYVKGTNIGKLSAHMNQCFGSSYFSYCRDVELVKEMYSYIKKYGFKKLGDQA